MPRPPRFIDATAEQLLQLRVVSSHQWLLRLIGAAAALAALTLALSGQFSANLGALMVSGLVVIGVLGQMRWPDTELGLLGPLAIVLAVMARPQLPLWLAAAVGLLLLVAHMSFAAAAMFPVHGVLNRSGWLLLLRAAGAAIGLAVLGSALVTAAMGVVLGPWAMLPAVLAALALLVAMLPRAPLDS